MTRIAGLAGNRGRNLVHIADSAPGGAELAVVLTDEESAPVLESAEDQGLPTEVVPHEEDRSRADHERRLLDALAEYEFDLVCLDGYMRVLTSTFLDDAGLVLNVHPSLLPSFPGLSVHEQVLEAGARVSGCTVHVVTEEVDAGPIVTQEPVPVFEDDSTASLKQRVLQKGEFRAYPRAVRWIAEDRLTIDDGGVSIDADDGGEEKGRFPARRLASTDRSRTLRYGENPHQRAAVYADPAPADGGVIGAEQLNAGAKALSYNNYNDADAALGAVREFDRPAAVVVKHTTPAGCAVADSPAVAYERALATDPMSAFGGIVALNRTCDRASAERIVESFKECVVAPGYTDDALGVLVGEESLRVLDVGDLASDPPAVTERPLVGGSLFQERDRQRLAPEDLEVVTDREPTDAERETMCFAWQVVKNVKSNAIVLATDTETVGIGAGQVSRVDAVRLATMKATEHAEDRSPQGSVLASDAFFPFPDGIEVAADAGVEAVVQPGGSVNDEEVIEAANEADMAMAFTGARAFRHD
ncbi:phosphoribosylglycinamide formyltransferase [Halobacteriales archaeon QH_8_64_26]|nr:MAG: phosphoribosylglycinamide formyltransferase [Halobacteriales archaeon QH_8_64_26]